MNRLLISILAWGAALSGVSCRHLESRSHNLNPVGWPSKGLFAAGFAAADSRIPLVRETGRWLHALGDLLEFPALLVESAATLDAEKLGNSGSKLVVGTGGTVTASLNLPFFFVTGRNVDIGREAALVNEALEYMEELSPAVWRYYPGDTREFVIPPGTRVHASGKNLIWDVPEDGAIIQAAQESPLFRLGQIMAGDFVAQERSWGMVVGNRSVWDARTPRDRTVTIIHEFYHQHLQMRGFFLSWTTAYWPAYGVSFARHGWWEHWAERESGIAAYIVDEALEDWRVPDRIPSVPEDRIQ